MREIYNEGRVVGLSAYELYVRHVLSEGLGTEPATELEWLSSTLGSGASLILKVPKGTLGNYEKQLPSGSKLCGASTITGCIFDGEVDLISNDGWAKKVVSYGQLISNSSTSCPNYNGTYVPANHDWNEEDRFKFKEYLKIVDGLVYHPGTWTHTTSMRPYTQFNPDLSQCGRVRIKVASKLETDVYILLTGWLNSTVIAGVTKTFEGSVDTSNPENGDFLGPECYPWASKIIFTVPSSVLATIYSKAYRRQLPLGKESKYVDKQPVIDYETSNPRSYYAARNLEDSSGLPIHVDELNVTGEGASAIATYEHTYQSPSTGGIKNFPPALYGAKLVESDNGKDSKMFPLDIAAPGTVKVFTNEEDAANYPKTVKNVFSIFKDPNKQGQMTLYYPDTSGNIQSTIIPTDFELGTVKNGNYYESVVKAGKDEVRAISLVKPKSGGGVERLTLSQDTTTDSISTDYVSWTNLLNALGTTKKLDILGEAGRLLKSRLSIEELNNQNYLRISGRIKFSDNIHFYGTGCQFHEGLAVSKDLSVDNLYANGKIQLSGEIARQDTYHFNTADDSFKFSKPVRTRGFISFPKDNLYLFIQKNKPTDSQVQTATGKNDATIPVGSIWIGG